MILYPIMNASYYSFIHVTGPDAEKFLQGQLTCDVQTIDETHPSLAAHCNSKGRIVSLFTLLKSNEGFYLGMPSDLISTAFTNLKKYAVFSKVTLENVGTTSMPSQLLNADRSSPVPTLASEHEWRLHNIRHGIPTVYAATSELFLPHDLNLPELGAVSFKKGCYTGQEIIARMQHLGKPKQHLYRLIFSFSGIPSPGAKLYAAADKQNLVGHIVDAVQVNNNIEALAVLKDALVNEQNSVELWDDNGQIISITIQANLY